MSSKHHLVLCTPSLYICAKQTNNRSPDFFFMCFWPVFFFFNSALLPSDRPAGKSFFLEAGRVYLSVFLKAQARHDIIPAPATLAEGESPVAPC